MEKLSPQVSPVKSSASGWVAAAGLFVLGAAICAGGIYVGHTDDAPGAALLGFVVMITLAVFGIKIVRRKP